jgi:hypothetical protein
VIFKNKFPAVLDTNEIYWMVPKPAEKPAVDEESDAWPEPVEPEPQPLGLRAIGYREIPLISGVTMTRSLSSGDLRTIVAKPGLVPVSGLLVTWVVQFGATVTQIWAREDTPVNEICDRAALSIGIPLQQWDIRGPDRRGSVVTIHCRMLEKSGMGAGIHFGNQEWRGKVNVLYSDQRLVQEAQAQLDIEGRWNSDASVEDVLAEHAYAKRTLWVHGVPKFYVEANGKKTTLEGAVNVDRWIKTIENLLK